MRLGAEVLVGTRPGITAEITAEITAGIIAEK